MKYANEILGKAAKIKLIISDVDGVLNDGSIFVDDFGNEPFARFNVLDGMAIVVAHSIPIHIAIVSGRQSKATEMRFNLLNVHHCYTGIHDKKTKVLAIAKELNIELTEIAYIGDDIIDIPTLKIVGLSCAPLDVRSMMVNYIDYISSTKGGTGVLRDVIELVLTAQNNFDKLESYYK